MCKVSIKAQNKLALWERGKWLIFQNGGIDRNKGVEVKLWERILDVAISKGDRCHDVYDGKSVVIPEG